MSKAGTQRSGGIARTVLAGLLLSGTPLMTMAAHQRNAPLDQALHMRAEVITTALGPRLRLPISTVDMTDLAGDDDIAVGDVVYVHNYREADALSYPYAISQNRGHTARDDANSVTLRAVVTDRTDTKLMLDYQFESALPVNTVAGKSVNAFISVSPRSVARLRKISPSKPR